MGPGLVARGSCKTDGLDQRLVLSSTKRGSPVVSKNGSLFLRNGTVLHRGALFRDNRTGDRNAGQVSLDMHHMDHVSQNNLSPQLWALTI